MEAHAPRVLLGVTASIAAYKAVEVARLLGKAGVRVQVAMTRNATKFVAPLTFQAITGRRVLSEVLEAPTGEIDHVERAHDVDLVLIAPASMSSIARLAAGIGDDALTAITLATSAPLMFAPAMESGMWMHPATAANVATLEKRGATRVGPGAGELASGRAGVGRMAEPQEIVDAALRQLCPGQLDGRVITMTAGPTWESLDPVRILSNRSTGTMGIAIAEEALRQGAEVRLVLGPTPHAPRPHPRLTVHAVESALEMLEATRTLLEGVDVFIASAAVSDFRPRVSHDQKLKRANREAETLELIENPDVLKILAGELRQKGSAAMIVGFAAETENEIDNARGKLERKGCDLVVANRVGRASGFGPGQTRVALVTRDGSPEEHEGTKAEVAAFLLDRVARFIGQR